MTARSQNSVTFSVSVKCNTTRQAEFPIAWLRQKEGAVSYLIEATAEEL